MNMEFATEGTQAGLILLLLAFPIAMIPILYLTASWSVQHFTRYLWLSGSKRANVRYM